MVFLTFNAISAGGETLAVAAATGPDVVIADADICLLPSTNTRLHPAKEVAVDLRGVNSLILVVTDGGDDMNYDHADWADARLTC